MDAKNRPSHPKLLDYLSDYFTEHRFDLRVLYATIVRTQAYQRTSAVPEDRRPPGDSFAAMTVKTLTAGQIYDSLQQNIFRRSPPSRITHARSRATPGEPTRSHAAAIRCPHEGIGRVTA